MLGSFSLQLKFHLHRGPIGLHCITLLSFLQSTDHSQDRKICLAHFLIVHLLSFISQPSATQRLCTYFSSLYLEPRLSRPCMHACMQSHFSHVWLFATLGTIAHHIPLSIHLQARILEWVSMLSSRKSSWPRDQTHISYVCWHLLCQVGSLPLAPPAGKPIWSIMDTKYNLQKGGSCKGEMDRGKKEGRK